MKKNILLFLLFFVSSLVKGQESKVFYVMEIDSVNEYYFIRTQPVKTKKKAVILFLKDSCDLIQLDEILDRLIVLKTYSDYTVTVKTCENASPMKFDDKILWDIPEQIYLYYSETVPQALVH